VELNRELFSANSLYPPPLGGAVEDSGTLQLSGSWELDFFGKNRAALDAAVGTVQAAAADAQAARLLLAGNVVRSYYQLARLGASSKSPNARWPSARRCWPGALAPAGGPGHPARTAPEPGRHSRGAADDRIAA
jgi:hypothetical protein